MDICGEADDVSQYSDEKLKEEKNRLLKQLYEEEKEEERAQNERALACEKKRKK